MIVKTLNFVAMLLVLTGHVSSWKPDAGLVKSWTKLPGVTAYATSGNDKANLVLDNNDKTHWSSGNCLPDKYITKPFTNVLLWRCNTSCDANSADTSGIVKITDGNLYTTYAVIADSNNLAKFTMNVSGLAFNRISIWGIYNADTVVKSVDEQGTEVVLKTLNSTDNYRETKLNLVSNGLTKIVIISSASFNIKEATAIGTNGCIERITVDLGAARRIGSIRTRHWAGRNAASSAKLLLSVDAQTWIEAKALVPSALQAVVTRIDSPSQYRYIAVEYHMNLRDYLKVFCWEIDAWDEFYLWGRPPSSVPNPVSLRQLLGVNGLWGWGHNKYSYLLQDGEGPDLFSQIATHARNYHNMDWDVKDPDYDPNYENMAKDGTNGSYWLDWDKEYKEWLSANLSIDASIQMVRIHEEEWDTPGESAFNFGMKFAKHFGPQIGNGNISAMEVGNEPWDVNASFYTTILEGMAAGARSVDQTIDVLPGAFQAYEIPATEPNSGNYIGNRVTEAASANISVINTHAYSFKTNVNGIRIATFPENFESTFKSIRNVIRWRDVNTPNKPIWLTEWGWDADGGNENCTNTECVSELAQAIYGARGLFMISRHGIQRATWYFFANTENCETLFCRSGLTTSRSNNFSKKLVFNVFEALLQRIGDQQFLSVLKEDENGYVYLYGKGLSNTNPCFTPYLRITHIVAWNPVDASDNSFITTSVEIPSDLSPVSAWKFTGLSNPAIESTDLPSKQGNTLTLSLSSKPLIIELQYNRVLV